MGLFALGVASGIYGLKVGGGHGLIRADGFEVATPAFPASDAMARHAPPPRQRAEMGRVAGGDLGLVGVNPCVYTGCTQGFMVIHNPCGGPPPRAALGCYYSMDSGAPPGRGTGFLIK